MALPTIGASAGLVFLQWKILFNVGKLIFRSEKVMEAGSKKLAANILRDIRSYVPYKTGETSDSVEVIHERKGRATLVWSSPWANIIYEGTVHGVPIKFNQAVHKNATHHWFEAAKSAFGKQWLLKTKKEIYSDWGVIR